MSVAPIHPRLHCGDPGVTKPFETVADMLRALGDVPPERVLLNPTPGSATEQDLLHEMEHNDRLVELVDDILVEKGIGALEDRIGSLLIAWVGSFIIQHQLGVFGGAQGALKMQGGNVRLPDMYFIAGHRLVGGIPPAGAIFAVGLDLAVEVLSPTNTRREMDRKRQEYFATGAQQVWEIDPAARTFAIYTSPETHTILTATDTLTGGTLLPGFELPLARLWQEIDHPLGK